MNKQRSTEQKQICISYIHNFKTQMDHQKEMRMVFLLWQKLMHEAQQSIFRFRNVSIFHQLESQTTAQAENGRKRTFGNAASHECT